MARWGSVPVIDHAVVPGYCQERLLGMIAAVCAEEFVAKPSYMGCRTCDYTDLCETGEKGDRS